MAALRITRVGTSHGHVQLVTHVRWQARADWRATRVTVKLHEAEFPCLWGALLRQG